MTPLKRLGVVAQADGCLFDAQCLLLQLPPFLLIELIVALRMPRTSSPALRETSMSVMLIKGFGMDEFLADFIGRPLSAEKQ